MSTVSVRCSFIENGVKFNDKFVVSCNSDKPSVSLLQRVITDKFEGVNGISDIKVIGVSCIVRY